MGRAHALEELNTLEVANVHVVDGPRMLKPEDLGGVEVQVLTLPWFTRSSMAAHLGIKGVDRVEVHKALEKRITTLVQEWLEQVDPQIPIILTAHASVQGAVYGGERTVMLGNDIVIPISLVKDERLDYVALGHIHKAQDLNETGHPPIVYPGSIERVDFGEAGDDKFFVIASVEKGKTEVDWRQLTGIRPFIDRRVALETEEGVTQVLIAALPEAGEMADAIVRLTVEYPREWEAAIDEASIRAHAAEALEFHLVKRPHWKTRIRLAEDEAVGKLSPLDLLERYFQASEIDEEEAKVLGELAAKIISGDKEVEID
jgi:exonuclease SbcD